MQSSELIEMINKFPATANLDIRSLTLSELEVIAAVGKVKGVSIVRSTVLVFLGGFSFLYAPIKNNPSLQTSSMVLKTRL
jgi:hypothetical protein